MRATSWIKPYSGSCGQYSTLETGLKLIGEGFLYDRIFPAIRDGESHRGYGQAIDRAMEFFDLVLNGWALVSKNQVFNLTERNVRSIYALNRALGVIPENARPAEYFTSLNARVQLLKNDPKMREDLDEVKSFFRKLQEITLAETSRILLSSNV